MLMTSDILPESMAERFKLHEPTGSFRERLAQEKNFEGWSQNPWRDKEHVDMQMTSTAKKYIRYFTDELIAMGFLPFTGVEVNCNVVPYGIDEAIQSHIENYTKDYRAWYAHEYHLKEEVEQIQSLFLEEIDQANWYHDEMRAVKKWLDNFDTDTPIWKCMEQDYIDYINSEVRSLERSGRVSEKFCNAFQRYLEKRELTYNKHMVGSYGINDEFDGRTYVDGTEIEITTPPGSPLATAAHVTAIKRYLFQGTQAYEELFGDSRNPSESWSEALANSTPRPESVENISGALGGYNIRFDHEKGTDELNSGEHFNVSLQWIGGRDVTYRNYRTIDNARETFREHNLMHSVHYSEWARLFFEALQELLPADTILAFGNDARIKSVNRERHPQKHSIAFEDGYKASARLELRTFNDASSNIYLSTLAVMADMYAIACAIKDVIPEYQMKLNHKQDIHFSDKREIINKLGEEFCMNRNLPSSIDSMKERFIQESPTIKMMYKVAEARCEHWKDRDYKPETYDEMNKEIDQFESQALERVDVLMAPEETQSISR